MFTTRRSVAAAGLLLLAVLAPTAEATVDLNVDAQTLTDLVGTMVPPEVPVELVAGQSLRLRIDDFRVTGFEPTSQEHGGRVLAALRMRVPELGLELPVESRLSLDVGERDGSTVCNLVFDEVRVALPLGVIDISTLLPSIPIPADTTNLIDSLRGLYEVRTWLVEATMGARALRLRFDLDVVPAPPQAAPAPPSR